ncbi:hypothetical protein LSH36_113g05004 [Paralvinella palmiformis]|uniref:Squalene cyclase C-terminal domain-containing protein n=1 Tax=Paralvinella palmiformis TaxID=53620 RepID=A0AAD9JYY8_9ANNE|nr:hypothetical protein LSH36_113g05004 [Paralvinella palmiformis]
MDVGSSILHHVERQLNACLTCLVMRHGTQGYQVTIKNSLGVAGFSPDVIKMLSVRLRSHQKAILSGNSCKEIDSTLYDIKGNNFDFSQLPKWLLIIVTENDLDFQENISAICRWYRRVKAWGCDCLAIVTAVTTPPTKTPPPPLSARIQDLCRHNPELEEMRSRQRLKTFYIAHWDSIEVTEQVFMDVVSKWLSNDSACLESSTEAGEDEHMAYSNIIKIIVRDLNQTLPQIEIFLRLFIMCFLGLLSVFFTLGVIVFLSKDGGMEKDLRRAEEYLVSHLEARRTPKSDWGSSHTPAVLIALQITNHHWCLDNVDNRRSVDRLEIGILASLARLSPKRKISSIYTPQRLAADINALLATFQDPRDFYDHDLVAILKRYITDVIPYTAYTAHAYSGYVIALCNNGEYLNDGHAERIFKKQNQDGGFYLGVNEAAISLMALSCVNQTVENLRKTEKIVSYIRGQRQHDGSYGALYSTALVLQAYNVTGYSVDTPTRKEATLSWLLRSCYGNAALKDPDVASAVLLALSGHSLLDIDQITGINHKKRTSTTLPSGGQQGKFRYLAPEVTPEVIRDKSSGLKDDNIIIVQHVAVEDNERNNATAETDISERKDTSERKDMSERSGSSANSASYLDRNTSTNQEPNADGAGAVSDDGVAVSDRDAASPKHRWKKWKRKFVDIDEDAPYEVSRDENQTKLHKAHKRRHKMAITVNEAGLGYIFLNQCFV